MRRLLKFFALQTLRVLAVVTIIMWGAGRVGTMYVAVPIGSVEMSAGCMSDGWVIGVAYQNTGGFRAGIQDRVISLSKELQGKKAFVDGQLWLLADDRRLGLGVSYPLTLLLLFATYAAFWFFSRRRQQSLQSKLADAARLR